MSITQPEDSTLGASSATVPLPRRGLAWPAAPSWLAALHARCPPLRWWAQRRQQERIVLRSEILDGLGLLRARLALFQMAAADASAHAVALRVIVGEATEQLLQEQGHLSALRHRAHEIGDAIRSLEAAADAPVLPQLRELRELLWRAHMCASQLSVIEGAMATRRAVLSQSHASLARVGGR